MNIHNLKQIETPRLIVRPVQFGDEKALNAAINRSLESLRPWMPWAKDPSIEVTKDYVDKGAVGWSSGAASDFPMVIMHKESHKIIGTSEFNDYSNVDIPFYEIGYWLDTAFQGQGLVTETVVALSWFAFKALGAKHVQIRPRIDNAKSIAVARRSGFSLDKTLKNDFIPIAIYKAAFIVAHFNATNCTCSYKKTRCSYDYTFDFLYFTSTIIHTKLTSLNTALYIAIGITDCITGEPADGLLFVCANINDLPPLEINWKHNDESTRN